MARAALCLCLSVVVMAAAAASGSTQKPPVAKPLLKPKATAPGCPRRADDVIPAAQKGKAGKVEAKVPGKGNGMDEDFTRRKEKAEQKAHHSRGKEEKERRVEGFSASIFPNAAGEGQNRPTPDNEEENNSSSEKVTTQSVPAEEKRRGHERNAITSSSTPERKNRFKTEGNEENRFTPEERKQQIGYSATGEENRFSTEGNRHGSKGEDKPRRRFAPIDRPSRGMSGMGRGMGSQGEGRRGRDGKGEPAWLAWYNTLPWRQEMLSQYGEQQRPQRAAFGL